MLEDVITEDTIESLVNRFYQKVRVDPELGPIFDAAIGQTEQQWKPHLERMYTFWSSVMLSSGRYHGNPMQKHKALPSFDAARFDRWLVVFAETAHEIHSHDIAEKYIEKSRRISESLKLALYYKPEGKMV